MITVHRHNPVLKNRLMVQVNSGNPEELCDILQKMSVAERRTAGYLLAEEVLPGMSSEKFWEYFMVVVPENSKAYLGTFLKAAVLMLKAGRLTLDDAVLKQFAEVATQIDTRKTLDALLPYVSSPDEARMLVQIFCSNQLSLSSPHLIKAGTPQTYFVLFEFLKTVEADSDVLRNHTIQLMKKGDPLSFNLASILRQYFDLKNIPGIFSLKLEPYELSRLDQGFEFFIKLIKR